MQRVTELLLNRELIVCPLPVTIAFSRVPEVVGSQAEAAVGGRCCCLILERLRSCPYKFGLAVCILQMRVVVRTSSHCLNVPVLLVSSWLSSGGS